MIRIYNKNLITNKINKISLNTKLTKFSNAKKINQKINITTKINKITLVVRLK